MVESRGAGCYEAVSLSTGIALVLRVLNRAICDWCSAPRQGGSCSVSRGQTTPSPRIHLKCSVDAQSASPFPRVTPSSLFA